MARAWDVPTPSTLTISAHENLPRNNIVSPDLFQYNFTNVSCRPYLLFLSLISHSLAYSHLYVHFTCVSQNLGMVIVRNRSFFRNFVTSPGTEILDHARELNRSTLSKVAVAADNGKSKSYRLSLSSAQWRRGGSSSARCCMRSYVCSRVCKWLQRIDGKAARREVFATRQKNLAFQCSCSRNAASDPCTKR